MIRRAEKSTIYKSFVIINQIIVLMWDQSSIWSASANTHGARIVSEFENFRMIMMDAWTFLWLIVCLTIFITILVNLYRLFVFTHSILFCLFYFFSSSSCFFDFQESIHRRLRQRQLRQEELELQRQIRKF